MIPDAGHVVAITEWLIAQGLAELGANELVDGFCERCRDAGLRISRALVLIDTLHPVHEGTAYSWRRDREAVAPGTTYLPTDTGEAARNWERSSFFHLLETGGCEIRHRFGRDAEVDFFLFDELRAEGHTDYVAFVHRFLGKTTIRGMDCLYAYWTSDDPNGFRDEDIAILRALLPTLALALKCTSTVRITETVLEIYLGRQSGRRVLDGRIRRGVAERIEAVIWFSDLRNFTRITETIPSDALIPLLDDYADLVVSCVHEAGGEVLKLIGDGVLAIFTDGDLANASRQAVQAFEALARGEAELNRERGAASLPVTGAYVAVHVGEVFYGNIGSDERLDFTVVGRAVNEASRMAAICRSVDRKVVGSNALMALLPPDERGKFSSLGRFALRGSPRAEELFTIAEHLVA